MVHPSSEREVFRWLRANSAILELLDLDQAPSFKLDKLYRLRDALQHCQTEIEAALFAQTRTHYLFKRLSNIYRTLFFPIFKRLFNSFTRSSKCDLQ